MRVISPGKLSRFLRKQPLFLVACILTLHFLVRIFIYYNTRLFFFGDYSAYLNGVDAIASGKRQYLSEGNYLFAISYIGYFAKYILGNIDYFFIFNCLLGTLVCLVVYTVIFRLTCRSSIGIIAIILLTIYTEFMVFSSVFYSTVIMVFIIAILVLSLQLFFESGKSLYRFTGLVFALITFLLSFFFKPELRYLPYFVLITGILSIKKNKSFSIKVLFTSILLLTSYYSLNHSGIINSPENNYISNSFVFFGHTDYGGDGGEGSFVYPENEERYKKALNEYMIKNNIEYLNAREINVFQMNEVKKFITGHPGKWIQLQFTKFFRTFGVVPETSSYKILYSGLLSGKKWLTAILVVLPVAGIIILFIIGFNFSAFKGLKQQETKSPGLLQGNLKEFKPSLWFHPGVINDSSGHKFEFLAIYLTIFIYYLVASIFYGQYQERYRIPLMVMFIIPMLSLFVYTFNLKRLITTTSFYVKIAIIVIFMVTWTLQAKKAILNKDRFNNAIEPLSGLIETSGE